MRNDKTQELTGHSRLPASSVDDSEEQPVHRQHPECADAGGNTEREGRKRDAQIIGHDRARSQWLNGDDRVGPHLMLVDGFHHAGAEKITLETRIENGH